MAVDVPAGKTTVVAEFRTTGIRRTAGLVSAAAFALCLAGLGRKGRWPRAAALAAALALASAWLLTGTERATAGSLPAPAQASFGDQLLLTGYQLDGEVLRPGSPAELRLHWFTRQAPSGRYAVALRLRDPSSGLEKARFDGWPTRGYLVTDRLDAGEIAVTTHALSIGPDVPAGRYELVLGLVEPRPYGATRVVPVAEGPATRAGALVKLGDVEVR